MKASGLDRRQDARDHAETGIPRSLIWFGVIASAIIVLATYGLVALLEQRDGQRVARATYALSAAQAGRDYALTRAGAALAIERWASEIEAAKTPATAIEALAVSPGDWLVVMNQQRAVTAVRGVSAQSWLSLVNTSDVMPAFVELDGAVYLLRTATLGRAARDGKDTTVYAAFNLTQRAATRDLEPALSITSANQDVPPMALVLDQVGEQKLTLTLTAPRPWLHDPLLLLAILALGLVLLVLSSLAWRSALGVVLGRYWQRQLVPLTQAIGRIRKGNCSEPLLTSRDHPLHGITRDFNAMQEDIEERQSKLDYQSQYDALTGLMTRAVANERISRAVDRATFANQQLAAVAIDVSRFNEINGSLGQDVGDLVLKELARRLSSKTRVSDTVARVGGDEFMLLLDNVDDRTAEQLVEFLVSTLEAPIVVRDKSIKLKIRAGLALFPDHGEGPKALRRMANIALMTAKESQRKVVMYEPGQDEKQLRELAIIHDLPGALRDDELYLQYQPKIDMESQRVEMVEALVRWRHPQLGFIPPDEFIGLLEKAGQISQLTTWVFKEAIKQVRDWNTAGYDLGVAVNISANDLRDEKLPDRIKDLLHHYVVKPSRVSIEVTESAVIEDPERAVAILQDFRRAGLKIGLDDFGTGQTSLSLLKQLPLSEVKIDKSFVQHLRADSGDAIIVKSIIDLGHNMGLLVTAEGVESNYCWNLLNSYECDLVQGYLVSAPLTSDELCQWYLRLQERHVNKLDYSVLKNAG